MRTVAITLVNKRRVQPETLAKIEKIVESGADHGIVECHPDEMGAFLSFNISVKEARDLQPGAPKPEKGPKNGNSAPDTEKRISEALARRATA